MCLLDRAYKVPQDIKSVQKMYLPLTVTMRFTYIPGIVLVFARMYIQCNVIQFNTFFIILLLISNNTQYTRMFHKNTLAKAFSNNFFKHINNSSSLNNVNHNCDGVYISNLYWYRFCNSNSPFSP